MIKKISIFLLNIAFIVNSSAAANKYAIADNYLENSDYEMAAQEYTKILEGSGPASLSKDIRAMTGAFICFYMLQEYKKSFALCKRVLKLQSYNGCAIFYAGQNLEALGNMKLANKLYRYYTVLSSSEPYRRFIKARFDHLNQREIEKKVQTAMQMEGRISTPQIPENSIAVLYLVNKSEEKSWDAFSKGFAQLMITDLSSAKSINLVNRTELQVLLNELQFDQNHLSDENLIPRLGRLLKTRYVISGSFTVIDNSQISFNVGLLNLKQPDIIDYSEFNGTLNNVFQLEKNILSKVINEMDVPITPVEKKKIMQFQTKNLDAFLAYCNGIDAYDFSNYDAAYNHFSLSSKMDPRFYLSRSMQQTVDAIIMIEQGNLAMRHFQIGKRHSMAATIETGTFTSSTRARLENISLNLDLGYLPGNDSRNGAGSLDLSNVQFKRDMLPEPPQPPNN